MNNQSIKPLRVEKTVNYIDTHVHFWQLSQKINKWVENQGSNPKLKKDFLPQSLLQHSQGLSGVVHIEAHDSAVETEIEINWLQKLSKTVPQLPIRHIACVDITLEPEAFEKIMVKLKSYPQVVGIRHILSFDQDENYSLQDKDLSQHPFITKNLKILQSYDYIFDAQAYPTQLLNLLPAIAESQVKTVIEHLAIPIFSTQDKKMKWQHSIKTFVQLNHVYIKLSGLEMFDKIMDSQEIIEFALKEFTTKKAVFGSNYPVCFTDKPTAWLEVVKQLDLDDAQAILFDNAWQLYGFNNVE